MEQQELKLCKMCYMQIDKRARRCPYCRHWQNKLTMIAYHPVFTALFVFVPLCIFYLIIATSMASLFDRGEPFAVYRDQIAVTSSELKFGENECGPTVAVVGLMKNNSDTDWEDMHLEVRFYDDKGQMVDSGHIKKYLMVIPAKSEKSFKISLPREFPQQQYASCKMTVTWAKEAGTFP